MVKGRVHPDPRKIGKNVGHNSRLSRGPSMWLLFDVTQPICDAVSIQGLAEASRYQQRIASAGWGAEQARFLMLSLRTRRMVLRCALLLDLRQWRLIQPLGRRRSTILAAVTFLQRSLCHVFPDSYSAIGLLCNLPPFLDPGLPSRNFSLHLDAAPFHGQRAEDAKTCHG